MIVAGLPYSEAGLSTTSTGGTPYGASHWSGQNGDHAISDEEASLCKAQGARIAMLATRLKGDA